MHEKDMYTAVPNGNSYAAMQAFLEQRLEEAGVSLRVQNRVQVAADEIWSNIVHYSGASQASLELRWEEETLFLRFTDDGKPYDPTAAPEPDTTLTADERKIGGLGLHMVRKMTTSMTYQYSGSKNSLTLGFTLI
ncbi:MAG: ATP-binding protein [Christensenellales bacterium]